MDHLNLILKVILWVTHCGLLFFINADVRGRSLSAKFAVTVFTFYTLTLLVPFYNYEHFDSVVDYTPSAMSLFLGICADISMIGATRWSFQIPERPSPFKGTNFGFSLLIFIAALAQVVDIVMNRELLLLPKELYIDAEKFPNLFVLSIPAQLILLGGALYSPFRKKIPRILVAILALVATVLSVVQGYRGIALIAVLYFVYSRWPKLSPLVPALLMTVAGELSNPLKYLIGGLLIGDNFDASNMFEYYSSNLDMLIGLSGEQKAIVSNLVLGMKDLAIGAPIAELRNIIPFTNSLFGDFTMTSASRLGEIAGVGVGQGTAYSFVLFIAESLIVAPLMMILVVQVMRLLSGTPLVFLSWTTFFSLMRDTPAFWAGEFKMSLLLMLLVSVASLFSSELSSLWSKSSTPTSYVDDPLK